MPSLPSSLSLPSLHEGRKTYQRWNASAAVLQDHSQKFPFLRLPMPSRETHLAEPDVISELRHDQHIQSLKMKVNARREFTMRGGKMPPLSSMAGAASKGAGLSLTEANNASSQKASTCPDRRKKRKATLYAASGTLHKRDAMQAALAHDRQFVLHGLEKLVEDQEVRKARDQQAEDHWLEAIFTPIPNPRELLPTAFREKLPLPKPTPVQKSHAPQVHSHHHHSTSLDFNHEEMEDIVDVCKDFMALTTPPSSLGEACNDRQAVLTRPLFCRLICAMCGLCLEREPGAPTMLVEALKRFDQHAESIHVKGCSTPGGCLVGYGLGYGGVNQPELRELPVLKLWHDLMHIMANKVPDSIARFPDQKLEFAHTRLIGELFPLARSFAVERRDYINRHVQSSIKNKATEEPPSPAASSSVASGPNGRRRGDSQVKEDSDVEEEEPATAVVVTEGTSLFAHTFAVLKGELLMSQLMEPEILHFLSVFRSLFDTLFNVYADVPLPDSQGHMTLSAFLRLCNDFQLFPTEVDFQTVQWLYNTCESCVSSSGRRLSAAPQVEVKYDTGDTPSSQTTSVGGMRAAGSKHALGRQKTLRRGKTLGKSPSSTTKLQKPIEPYVLWSGKWIRAHLDWLTTDRSDRSPEQERSYEILAGMGDWMVYRSLSIQDLFTFLVPEKAENSTNVRTRDRPGQRKSLKNLEENSRNEDVIPMDAFVQAIEFMRLENSPSPEEINQLAVLLKGPTREDLELGLLKEAFVVISSIKESIERAKSCFLKDPTRMSQEEYSASLFFKELMFTLEHNGWTADKLFTKIDRSGDGEIDCKELEREVRIYLKTTVVQPSNALLVENVFDMFDTNHDGRLTREEFVNIFDQVSEARAAQKEVETRHPLFLSNSGLQQAGPGGHRIFGPRAFVECLVKIALVRLSFHGTAPQSESNSMFKSLWLVLYMHGIFKLAKSSAKPPRKGKLPTPLQRLCQDYPMLFQNAGELSDSDFSSGTALKWGSKIDGFLQQCLEDPSQPRASGHTSLDGQMLALALG
jgi:hypothetical protein